MAISLRLFLSVVSACLYMYLSVCLSFYLTVYPSICLYKIVNDLAPSYMAGMFTSQYGSQVYSLRNSTFNFEIPNARTEPYRNSFAFTGAKIWNALPEDFKTAPSLNAFKRKIKSYNFGIDNTVCTKSATSSTAFSPPDHQKFLKIFVNLHQVRCCVAVERTVFYLNCNQNIGTMCVIMGKFR